MASLKDKIKSSQNKNGFSIIEVVAAFTIMTVGMMGVASLSLLNIQANRINKNYLIASMLAQEGLELVRNVRDNNWLTLGNNWNDDITGNDGNYTIDYNFNIDDTPDLPTDGGAKMYLNGNGFYDHDSAGAFTPYYRLIAISEDASGNFFTASSTVSWADSQGQYSYIAETSLFDWY
ncbi:MAG: prepilin-type N-terminal cleavage/methylation domain-containing protein [Patescibacteria group bacterium]|nr:prepilin-type N-terminal cleavage/methylation domain-containing protein [Patescibacteria group bacterium]